MTTDILEIILIIKKIVIYLSIIATFIMMLNIPIYLFSRISDYRRLEWSKEKFIVELKKPLIIRISILVLVSIILIIFYLPLDLLDKTTDFDYIMYYEVEPYTANRSLEVELNVDETLEILSILEDLKCHRSLSSGHIYLDYPTIFLGIHGDRNRDYRYMQLIITDNSTIMITGMNIDFVYIVDTEDLEVYSLIRNIIDFAD